MGNILLIGVVSSIPLFSRASLQRMMVTQAMREMQMTEIYPGLVSYKERIVPTKEGTAEEAFLARRDMFFNELPGRYNLPVAVGRERISIDALNMEAEVSLRRGKSTFGCTLAAYSEFEAHVEITKGRMFNTERGEDGVFEVVVSDRTLDVLQLLLNVTYVSTHQQLDNEAIRFRIVGVFANSDELDLYWSTAPASMETTLIAPFQLMYDMFVHTYVPAMGATATWEVNLDCASVDPRDVQRYKNAIAYYKGLLVPTFGSQLSQNLDGILGAYEEKESKLNMTLWVLQVPMFVMLAFFIYMVSGKILSLDKNDISVLKSRGATRWQIVRIYVLQGLLVSVLSVGIGLALGVLICRVIGSANGFLEFVGRKGLTVRMGWDAVAFAGVAILLSMLTMLIPVIQYSKVNIVDLKREAGERKKAVWHRLYLDVLALGVALYGFFSFQQQAAGGDLGMAGSAQAVDPLLFLTSSLFITGLGLVCLRFFPYFIGLCFKICRRFASPSLYASMQSVRRSGGSERFIMIFLMFTLAAGIFNARTALSINSNAEDQMYYANGVDLRVFERWTDNALRNKETNQVTVPATVFYEPDYAKYKLLPEVSAVTKVLMDKTAMLDGREKINLVGIIPEEFGEIVWYRNDLLPLHINHYLNVLAMDTRAILLSSEMKGKYKIGDTLEISTTLVDKNQMSAKGVVYGFFDYWPGLNPQMSASAEADYLKRGGILEKDKTDLPTAYAITNLSMLNTDMTIMPYEVWMSTDEDTGNFLTRFASERRLRFASYYDTKDALLQHKNDPVVQGTNGELTVNFIVMLLVCAIGFLIYWILSMKSRALQFGVFRAMGMSMRGVLAILVHEQILVSGVAILLGAVIGEVASRLFVPIIQIAYSASENAIPLNVVANASDYAQLLVFVGAMMIVCITTLGIISSRIRIAAALKLGED